MLVVRCTNALIFDQVLKPPALKFLTVMGIRVGMQYRSKIHILYRRMIFHQIRRFDTMLKILKIRACAKRVFLLLYTIYEFPDMT